jgi:short-subunit dehydrogenase
MHKLIVVTGGTKGIGRAILEKFAANGFDIATCARNQNDLTQLKKDFESKFKIKVFAHVADMSDKNQIKQFTDALNQLGRPIDVLVNNAGYFEPGQIMEEPDGTLEGMIEGNVYSAYYTTRGIISKMKESKSGHIFNMCSIASFMA